MAALAETARPLTENDRRNRTLVRLWLYVVLAVLVALVMVGGATRMTGSGLSITEWKPIHGVVPPLNEAEWQEEFAKYQQIPQYQQINKDMTLGEFKYIFWWEWAHRLLARGVGFLVALPLAFFWLAGRLERDLKPRLAGLLALGARQGAIGWWMVASGLVERVSVSLVPAGIDFGRRGARHYIWTPLSAGLAVLFARAGTRSVGAFRGGCVLMARVQSISGAGGGLSIVRPDLLTPGR